MTQIAFPTKWKFIVEYEDDETKEVSGILGQADTYEECEALIEHESQERFVVNIEAWEVCAERNEEGKTLTSGSSVSVNRRFCSSPSAHALDIFHTTEYCTVPDAVAVKEATYDRV
jgi:hypothetical protein